MAEVQHFLNCIPVRSVRAEKAIYQPGTLRLVSLRCFCNAIIMVVHLYLQKKQTLVLSTLKLNLPELRGISLEGLPSVHPFALHMNNLHLTDQVCEYSGVIGQDRELVHSGDFVQLSSCHEV